MKSPFITVSLSHSLSLRIVLLMQQYQEGKRCKVQFYHLYFKSFIRMSTFYCNKALSPYNNIPFHVLLLLIAAKAFFSLCFLRWQLKMRTLFILLGSVHTWCPGTSTRAPAQNGAVFRHTVPSLKICSHSINRAHAHY